MFFVDGEGVDEFARIIVNIIAIGLFDFAADGEREVIFDRVEEDAVAHDVAIDGHEEGETRGVHAFEEAGAAEAHHAFTGAREVVKECFFFLVGEGRCVRGEIFLEAVAREAEVAHGGDGLIGIEAFEHVAFGGIEFESFWEAVWEIGARAIFADEVVAVGGRVVECVIAADEGARAAHEVELHEVAPIVGLFAAVEGVDARERDTVMGVGEFLFAAFDFDLSFWADAEVFIGGDEEFELVAEVREVFVVWGCGEEEDLVILVVEEALDIFVAGARAVAEVVAFIDDDEAIEAFARRVDGRGDGAHGHFEVVELCIAFPHIDEFRRAEDEGGAAEDDFVDFSDGGCGDSFAEADDVANHGTAALFEVAHGKFDGGFLVFEEVGIERGGQSVVAIAFACFAA